jgi:hypothetical protein
LRGRPWGPTRSDERDFVRSRRAHASAQAALASALVPLPGLGSGCGAKARRLGGLGSGVPLAHGGNDPRLGAAAAGSATDARRGLAGPGSSSGCGYGGSGSGAQLPVSLCLDRLPFLRSLAVTDARQRAKHASGGSGGGALGRRQRRRHLPYLEAAGVGTGGGEEQRALEAATLRYPH